MKVILPYLITKVIIITSLLVRTFEGTFQRDSKK